MVRFDLNFWRKREREKRGERGKIQKRERDLRDPHHFLMERIYEKKILNISLKQRSETSTDQRETLKRERARALNPSQRYREIRETERERQREHIYERTFF